MAVQEANLRIFEKKSPFLPLHRAQYQPKNRFGGPLKGFFALLNFFKKWQELLPKHHRVARNHVEQFSDDLRGFKIASSKFCFTFAAFGDHLNVVDDIAV